MADIRRLLEVMSALRDPAHGCPWDLEQTFETIAPYTIEEAYEVADAITRGDWSALADELGDLLLQVVFHAQMAREADLFSFDDVVDAIVDKMVRRHPHVFAGERIESAQQQAVAWEEHKSRERRAAGAAAAESVLDAVTRGLPAFHRALKLQARAARAGFDWPDAAGVLAKLDEELGELTGAMRAGAAGGIVAGELGDLLFTCVNLARHLGLDPEAALRQANLKFEQRFRRMEALLHERGDAMQESTPEQLDLLWERVKEEAGPR